MRMCTRERMELEAYNDLCSPHALSCAEGVDEKKVGEHKDMRRTSTARLLLSIE